MSEKKLPKEIKALKQKIKDSGLSYPQVFSSVGITRGWFLRMIRGEFLDPNPEWIKAINNFVDDWNKLKTRYKVQ